VVACINQEAGQAAHGLAPADTKAEDEQSPAMTGSSLIGVRAFGSSRRIKYTVLILSDKYRQCTFKFFHTANASLRSGQSHSWSSNRLPYIESELSLPYSQKRVGRLCHSTVTTLIPNFAKILSVFPKLKEGRYERNGVCQCAGNDTDHIASG
jgi:hypothetical protein